MVLLLPLLRLALPPSCHAHLCCSCRRETHEYGQVSSPLHLGARVILGYRQLGAKDVQVCVLFCPSNQDLAHCCRAVSRTIVAERALDLATTIRFTDNAQSLVSAHNAALPVVEVSPHTSSSFVGSSFCQAEVLEARHRTVGPDYFKMRRKDVIHAAARPRSGHVEGVVTVMLHGTLDETCGQYGTSPAWITERYRGAINTEGSPVDVCHKLFAERHRDTKLCIEACDRASNNGTPLGICVPMSDVISARSSNSSNSSASSADGLVMATLQFRANHAWKCVGDEGCVLTAWILHEKAPIVAAAPIAKWFV